MAFPEAGTVIICCRPDDPQFVPQPGMVRGACADCGHAVMIGLESQRRIALEATPVACVRCYARFADAGNPNVLCRQRPLHRAANQAED